MCCATITSARPARFANWAWSLSPSLGNVFIDDNGTPANLNDDFFSYRANSNATDWRQFTYVIVTDDNVRSTAEVTIALGNQNANADVAFDFALVSGDGSGTPISGVSVGERFGVQVNVEDQALQLDVGLRRLPGCAL